MKVTREDVDALLKRQAPRGFGAQPQAALDPRLLAQAKVATEHVTGSEHWDVFLQRVQALINKEAEVLRVEAMAWGAVHASDEAVQKMHRYAIHHKAKIEAWQEVLGLPKDIMEATLPTAEAPKTAEETPAEA